MVINWSGDLALKMHQYIRAVFIYSEAQKTLKISSGNAVTYTMSDVNRELFILHYPQLNVLFFPI